MMGARGKKRKRANGTIASGKQPVALMPEAQEVPPVEADQVRDGFDTLRAALAEAGEPEASSAEWHSAYRTALDRLKARHSGMLADAILWRATFLDLIVGWDKFQERHKGEGELPTASMFEVAATIPTYGDETSFDSELFEAELADWAEYSAPHP